MLSKFYGRIFGVNDLLTIGLDVIALMLATVMAMSLRQSHFGGSTIIIVLMLFFVPLIGTCMNIYRNQSLMDNLVKCEGTPNGDMIKSVNDARNSVFWTAINVIAKLSAVGQMAASVYLFLTFQIDLLRSVEILIVSLIVTCLGTVVQFYMGSPKLNLVVK